MMGLFGTNAFALPTRSTWVISAKPVGSNSLIYENRESLSRSPNQPLYFSCKISGSKFCVGGM